MIRNITRHLAFNRFNYIDSVTISATGHAVLTGHYWGALAYMLIGCAVSVAATKWSQP